MRILVVEDSAEISQLIIVGLKPYIVEPVYTLGAAEEALSKESFDVILIDVLLPDGNGLDLCHRLSEDVRFCNVPKIILTGKSETDEVVSGFNCGADDYITKPFQIAELKARIDRFFRDKAQASVVVGEFHFDVNFQRCFIMDSSAQKEDLQLTPTEFRIFLALGKASGQVVSRAELEQAIWKANQTFIKVRGIDTHIANIRRKLRNRKDVIVSVYGSGYAFNSEIRETG